MSKERVQRYYDQFDEWGRLGSAAGRLEFLRTFSIIERYLQPPALVLDLGGGPGRYTIALAERGFKVALADLSEGQLDFARRKIQGSDCAENVMSIRKVDASDLSDYEDASFDALLALGPFYHLVQPTARVKAAQEVARVLRPGGTLLVSFMPYLTGIRGLITRAAYSQKQVSSTSFEKALTSGVYNNSALAGFQEGYFATSEEITSLFAAHGFSCVALISVRGLACDLENALGLIQESHEALHEKIMDGIKKTESDPSVLELCGHALYVGRRSPFNQRREIKD